MLSENKNELSWDIFLKVILDDCIASLFVSQIIFYKIY